VAEKKFTRHKTFVIRAVLNVMNDFENDNTSLLLSGRAAWYAIKNEAELFCFLSKKKL
jgi:hypothetical protein